MAKKISLFVLFALLIARLLGIAQPTKAQGGDAEVVLHGAPGETLVLETQFWPEYAGQEIVLTIINGTEENPGSIHLGNAVTINGVLFEGVEDSATARISMPIVVGPNGELVVSITFGDCGKPNCTSSLGGNAEAIVEPPPPPATEEPTPPPPPATEEPTPPPPPATQQPPTPEPPPTDVPPPTQEPPRESIEGDVRVCANTDQYIWEQSKDGSTWTWLGYSAPSNTGWLVFSLGGDPRPFIIRARTNQGVTIPTGDGNPTSGVYTPILDHVDQDGDRRYHSVIIHEWDWLCVPSTTTTTETSAPPAPPEAPTPMPAPPAELPKTGGAATGLPVWGLFVVIGAVLALIGGLLRILQPAQVRVEK